MTVTWNYPTRIVSGAGALAELGPEARRLGGRRALVVSDPGVARAGLVARAVEALGASGVPSATFEEIGTNPTQAQAEAAAAAYRTAGADFVVAIGGGAAIDVGKIVRILASHPPPLDRYDDATGGSERITEALPPMVAIPTTAGTGSEVGRSAVATLAATGRKAIFFSPRLIPSVALLDPTLTLSLPPRATAATGFDALTHCVEALSTPMHHPMAAGIAREGIRLVAKHLERAVRDGNDLEARTGMLEAATLGAVAFQRGLGACHSLAHPLSAEFDMHHGLANALCLPAVCDFNREAATEALAFVAQTFGERGADEPTLAGKSADAVRALRARVGLPSGLREAGVPENALERLADLAFEDPCHRENPRACTRNDLLAMYRASL
jgi:alcohol dehydrogenase class IV